MGGSAAISGQITTARRFVVDRLGDCPMVDDAVLPISELASNIVKGSSPNFLAAGFGLLAEHEHGGVRVTVYESGSYFDLEYVIQSDLNTKDPAI